MIELLKTPIAASDLDDLANLLVDAVAGGASVSFMAPLSHAQARRFWQDMLPEIARGAIVLVARDELGIAGTVQLVPAWAPNQSHRADIAKLLVHRRARRRRLGMQLMQAIEEHARARPPLTLLTLDTQRDSAADMLYRAAGWICAGIIPSYALDPDGTPRDTVIFYKSLT